MLFSIMMPKLITINPIENLKEHQAYKLAYSEVKDMARNIKYGENIVFTTGADSIAPLIETLSSADGDTSITVDANLQGLKKLEPYKQQLK